MEDPNQEKKSRFDLQPHYIEWGLTALGVIVACVLVVFVLFRMTIIWGVIKKFFSILCPFIYGFVMAYLLTPMITAIRSAYDVGMVIQPNEIIRRSSDLRLRYSMLNTGMSRYAITKP